jgi:hypothetical protein
MLRSGYIQQAVCSISLLIGLGAGAASAPEAKSGPSPAGAHTGATNAAFGSVSTPRFRGVFFNPKVTTGDPSYSWLSFYPQHRAQVRTALRELVSEAGINLVDIFVSIPYSLKTPAQTPPIDKPFGEWANLAYLDNAAAFVDDCYAAGVSVELDLVSNMWIPYSVDPKHQIANSGYWPMPGETPWNPSSTWYREAIQYIEAHAVHPEAIGLWCMMGNYELGSAEPCLWERNDNPAILTQTEQFLKRVWPVFRAAGKRPKAPPILLPIFSTNSYWSVKSPRARLSAFSNLKQWVVDDLALPPDYWVMTSYPFCDPAPDGFRYLQEIVKILGPGSASRLLSTDLKGPGHADVADCIMSIHGCSGPDLLKWHLEKCAQYGFAGWWIWAYQDTPTDRSGIRDLDGNWKTNLTPVLRGAIANRHETRSFDK